ncbi:hypothetical protein [Gilvibacter sediminis]|uniref:hypothetical protein n=1 Tax=Gilvibacter sediminis TaxID=379071 RepID=UPI0023505A0A|nr:hypothetical protein [Gilvibacter sediminis]MDC7997987.1 hypothetical protein [Gilvibacter sediminis]
MNNTISSNQKSLEALEKLMSSGYYSGYIYPDRFDLVRSKFPMNHKISGRLNSEKRFVVVSVFKKGVMTYMFVVVIVFLAFLSGLAYFKYGMFYALFIIGFLITILLNEYFTRRKELKLFYDRFLSFTSG